MTVGSRSFRKVLIANRGEIAVRVLRALKDFGIRGAVVYSDPDRLALPVLLADEAYRIGPAPSRESYLRGEEIVRLAVEIGADAIHPGYGFLSENAGFARQCQQAGVVFIGPTPEAMSAMGSKIECRRRMRAAGVPVVPGGQDPLADEKQALRAADEIGLPVMLKAAAGGGGKGMRLVRQRQDLPAAYRAARAEARASFNDDAVYLEKYIEAPRHVEIQVLGDRYGKVLSLGERECSLQRRHQKVMEEAPSTAVSSELRKRMGDAAVRAAAAVAYTNAGTCEFLLTPDGEFYFLEMNTRLQVEHPVTEVVTGIDLVAAQLRIAMGEPLPTAWQDIQPRGHALEARLYAEAPYRNFAPSPGRIQALRWPEGPGVRVDSGVYQGSEVTVHYDPLLAKLICFGADREEAMCRFGRALGELRIEGIETSAPLFRALLENADFRAARFDIGWLDRELQAGRLRPIDTGNPALPLLAAAIQRFVQGSGAGPATAPPTSRGARAVWHQTARREALRG